MGVNVTKIESQSFMEALEAKGIPASAKEKIMDNAERHYEEIMYAVIEGFVPIPDLPLFINILRSFIKASELAAPEAYGKALQMLSEEELLKEAEIIKREVQEGVK